MPGVHEPLLLFPDAETGGAMLFEQPCGHVIARTPSEVVGAFDELRRAVGEGLWAAGGITYEAAAGLEPRLGHLHRGEEPLLAFWLFRTPMHLPAPELQAWLDRFGQARHGPATPLVQEADHAAAVLAAQRLIAAGDIYQVNLTLAAEVPVAGHPAALFARLWTDGRPPHAALVNTGTRWWLSLSPELFVEIQDGRLTTRPMKGTAPRGTRPEEDRAAAEALRADAKNRAENLMIVDLLRNDLARVAVPGSVAVAGLFEIETYPSIHQMTSTVTARLGAGLSALDALAALFPCGSITGAPKIRAMEVIHGLEPGPRGIYCGNIGWIAPGGQDARFNVAIRTLVIDGSGGSARLGLGSGIVADSVAAEEWRECLAKARFLAPSRPASLLETMRREADGSIALLERHLARLSASATRFGFACDRAAVAAAIAALPVAATPGRLRLKLSARGAFALQLGALPAPWPDPVPVALVPLGTAPEDWRLAHKTSDRAPYEAALAAARALGAAEALLVRTDGLVTEGATTSLFVDRKGTLLTPPLALGLLPGVLRQSLLEQGRAREAPLTAADVATASADSRLFIGNALRGLAPAQLLQA